MIMEGYMGD